MQTIMKTKKYILFALAVLGLATSCQDKDWDAPSSEKGMEAYGNKYLQETNVKTIAEVIALYSNETRVAISTAASISRTIRQPLSSASRRADSTEPSPLDRPCSLNCRDSILEDTASRLRLVRPIPIRTRRVLHPRWAV